MQYGRIINERHFDRIMKLMSTGVTVIHGGQSDRNDKYIAPTLLDSVDVDADIMKEEIFGPLLPVRCLLLS